jgi:hypothetical protein
VIIVGGMSTAQYAAGLGFFAGTVGSVLVSAGLLLHRKLTDLRGAPGLLAFSVLTTAGLVAVHLVPGALGVLTRGAVLGCSLALLVLTLAVTRRANGALVDPDGLPIRKSGWWSWLIAGVSVSAVAVGILDTFDYYAGVPAQSIDALNYHLPYLAEWIQTGSVWHVGHFTPGQPSEYIPNNNGLVFLSAMLPWRSDFLVRASLLPYLALSGVAVYAIGVELGARRASAAVLAAAVLAMPIVINTSIVDTLPDAVPMATVGAGTLFLLRHARTRARSDLVLAGIGLGLAFGSKWTGTSSAAVALVVWSCAWLIAGIGWRRAARSLGIVVGLMTLTGGFWLLRNLVATGNPIFPVKVAPFGIEILDAPRDSVTEQIGRSIASYAGDPDAWQTHILPSWWTTFALPGVVLALGTALAAAVSLRRWRRESRPSADTARLLTTAAGAIALFGVYLVTPYTAFGPDGMPLTWVTARYFGPGLVVAAGLTAWAIGALGRARVVAELAGAIAVLQALDANVGLPGPHDLPGATTAVLGGVLLVIALTTSMGRETLDRFRRRAHARTRLAVAAGAAALALGGVAAVTGHRLEERFTAGRYVDIDPVFDWINHKAPKHRRIGLAGHWSDARHSPVFPAFGPSFGNHVTYVGPVERHMLREYSRPAEFKTAVRRGDFDLLLVGKGRVQIIGLPPDPLVLPWARSAGFEPVASSRGLALLRRPSPARRRPRADTEGPSGRRSAE